MPRALVSHPAQRSLPVPAEGDRKAYYETSQWTIKQNRETLAAVKVGVALRLRCSVLPQR